MTNQTSKYLAISWLLKHKDTDEDIIIGGFTFTIANNVKLINGIYRTEPSTKLEILKGNWKPKK